MSIPNFRVYLVIVKRESACKHPNHLLAGPARRRLGVDLRVTNTHFCPGNTLLLEVGVRVRVGV